MSTREVSALRGDMQVLCQKFLAACKEQNIDVLITCTYRDWSDQNRLYAQGRTAPGKIVTNARAGQSAHNNLDDKGVPQALAFDMVPLRNGKPVWDARDPIWQVIGSIGESVGLEWAGRWPTFKEFPHFQVKGFKAPDLPLKSTT